MASDTTQRNLFLFSLYMVVLKVAFCVLVLVLEN
jgi:hypothetical protein